MSTFDVYLTDIKQAVYGEEVRGALHDGLKVCYEEMTAGVAEVEQARIEIESARSEIAQARVEITADTAVLQSVEEAVAADRLVVLQTKNDVLDIEKNINALVDTVGENQEEITQDVYDMAMTKWNESGYLSSMTEDEIAAATPIE